MSTEPSYNYSAYAVQLQDWLQNTAESMVDNPSSRDWCIPDDWVVILSDNATLLPNDIYKYFDTTTLNSDYQKEYDKVNGKSGAANGTFTNKPIAYNQTHSDNIDGLSKMYVCRYTSRLKSYRDDAEQKAIRTYSSISLALGKLAVLESIV